jgi:hypothetical protein
VPPTGPFFFFEFGELQKIGTTNFFKKITLFGIQTPSNLFFCGTPKKKEKKIVWQTF